MRLKTLLASAAAALISGALVAQAQTPGVNSNWPIVWRYIYEASSLKPTYSATANLTSTATAAQAVCALSGSASKTIRVRRVILSGAMTAIEAIPISINKHSTLYTAGGGAQATTVPYDSQSAAATAILEYWTANPTPGTSVGTILDQYVPFGNTTTGVEPPYEMKFGEFGSAAVLRGAAQYLSVNFSGTSINTGKVNCTFEWTEESGV